MNCVCGLYLKARDLCFGGSFCLCFWVSSQLSSRQRQRQRQRRRPIRLARCVCVRAVESVCATRVSHQRIFQCCWLHPNLRRTLHPIIQQTIHQIVRRTIPQRFHHRCVCVSKTDAHHWLFLSRQLRDWTNQILPSVKLQLHWLLGLVLGCFVFAVVVLYFSANIKQFCWDLRRWIRRQSR